MFKSDKDADDTVASRGQVNAMAQENPLTTKATDAANAQSSQITDAANAVSTQATSAANTATTKVTDAANVTTKATEASKPVAESQSSAKSTQTMYVPGVYTS